MHRSPRPAFAVAALDGLPAVILAFAIMAAPAAAKECHWKSRWIWGSASTSSATAPSARLCLYVIHVGIGSIRSLAIVSPPINGTARVVSQNAFSYQSKAGFAGEDRFVLSVVGTGRRARGVTRMTVAVNVE